jgi:hypothetical protein
MSAPQRQIARLRIVAWIPEENKMNRTHRISLAVIVAAGLFGAGYGAGQAKNRFGQPHTIIHISLIKWKAGVSDADKQKALDGVKDLAAQIPGIRNIWIKAERMQPRDYNDAFAIEFENRDAADNYAESPLHEKWSKDFLAIREASISPQIGNPK